MMPTAPTEEYTWLLETCSVFMIKNCRYYDRLVDSSKHNNPCLPSNFFIVVVLERASQVLLYIS